MSQLTNAIALLTEEVSVQGTPQQPKDGTTEWYLLRARAIGLSWLKQQAQLDLGEDFVAADQHFQRVTRNLKGLDHGQIISDQAIGAVPNGKGPGGSSPQPSPGQASEDSNPSPRA